MTDKKLNKYKKWLEKQGYDFEGDEFWMEDYVRDHTWHDIIKLIDNYVTEQQMSPEQSDDNDNKVLYIVNTDDLSISCPNCGQVLQLEVKEMTNSDLIKALQYNDYNSKED